MKKLKQACEHEINEWREAYQREIDEWREANLY